MSEDLDHLSSVIEVSTCRKDLRELYHSANVITFQLVDILVLYKVFISL
jgi:hypothetical protein